MHVLHVQKAAGVSGAERHLLALLPGLRAAGVDVAMCVLVSGDGQAYVNQLRRAGVTTYAFRAGPHVNPVAVARIARTVRRFGADLVHTHLIHGDVHGVMAARVTRTPVVSSVHGRPSFYHRQPVLAVGRAVGRAVARRIAISDAVAGFILELGLGSPGRIDVVPYGIDVREWRASAADTADARRRFGVADGEVAVGIASRLIPQKGHDVLIDAVAIASRSAANLRLLVAGDGPLRADLAARAAGQCGNQARFVGFVSDVRAFMWACDVVAFPADPALGEGFGLAALEAMAAGRPVVATPTGALGELVDNGVSGLLVDPGSSEALAGALVTLARDDGTRAAMGRAGAARAAQNYSLEAMVGATIAVYESAASRR